APPRKARRSNFPPPRAGLELGLQPLTSISPAADTKNHTPCRQSKRCSNSHSQQNCARVQPIWSLPPQRLKRRVASGHLRPTGTDAKVAVSLEPRPSIIVMHAHYKQAAPHLDVID